MTWMNENALMYECCFCRPGFLPDPNDGSLYVLGGKHKEGLMVRKAMCVCHVWLCVIFDFVIYQLSHLQKLPFTIPELVQSAPCRSSDGMLYTGECVCVWTRTCFTTMCLTLLSETDSEPSIQSIWHTSVPLANILFCLCVWCLFGVYVHMKGKSRMCGLWWILRQVRNKPVWPPPLQNLSAPILLCCTLAAQVCHTHIHTGIFICRGSLSMNFAPACFRICGHHVWHQDAGVTVERDIQWLLCSAIRWETRLQYVSHVHSPQMTCLQIDITE